MQLTDRIQSPDYRWLEFGFLIFITFGISLVSDMEYSAYEEHNLSGFTRDFGYRLVTESLELICYCIFYWFFLKPCVLERKVLLAMISCMMFVLMHRVFEKYVINWAVAHCSIIAEHLRSRALKELHNPRLFFTFNYQLIATIFPLTGLALLMRSIAQDKRISKLKARKTMAELSYLKAQLHPHFFFNTINNIYALALKQSKDTATMVAKLGEMMRYILYEAQQPQVLLSREIVFLEDYIAVERLRYSSTVRINFDDQGVEPDTLIPPLLLLPFVENAFKHGLEEEMDTGYVDIVILEGAGALSLQVINSRPQTFTARSEEGLGIINVRKRLDLLYPGRYQLNIVAEQARFEVNLKLGSS
ncbi:sensor histidine kinase [Pedobacter aquatilis]|uniref:sensor histidine kinase n=1 Tax=Pedobacter aquatilis TaxID=351343 RepID=UPI002930C029|nr:sensor histidine kinase [Pedobacter aquatilis]